MGGKEQERNKNMTEQDLGVQKRYNRIMRTAISISRHLWYTLKRLDKTNERGDPGQMHLYTLKESISGPVILWGMYPFQEGEKERTAQTISDWMGEISYTLIAFQVTDWNRDFSPWNTENLSESFSGGAKDTLRCLLEEQIPKIRQQYGQDRELYLMGYSLAGLFALWTAYQTDLFAGVASCSGSFWYPGLIPYLRKQEPLKGRRIYISLGGKEAGSGNELMATVGERTREIVQLLAADNMVKYELNPGGHFADAGKRLAKAVSWIAGEKGSESQKDSKSPKGSKSSKDSESLKKKKRGNKIEK